MNAVEPRPSLGDAPERRRQRQANRMLVAYIAALSTTAVVVGVLDARLPLGPGNTAVHHGYPFFAVGMALTLTAVGVLGWLETRSVTWRSRAGHCWIAWSAVAVTVGAVTPYLVASLPVLAKGGVGLAQNFVNRPPGIRVALYVHLSFAGLALLLSPLRFSARVRNRFRRLHRAVGRTVLVAIVVGGGAGVVISTASLAGTVGTLGFGLDGILWTAFALAGYGAIRRGEVDQHRQWMVRAFAPTCTGVTLRLRQTLSVLTLSGLGMDDTTAWNSACSFMPFLCWIPNPLLAEWWLRRDPEFGGRRREDPGRPHPPRQRRHP